MGEQTKFYPCNETASSLCTKCNAGLTSGDGTNGSDNSSTPGTSAAYGPEDYCATSCNTTYCQTSQSYCSINHQYIKDHGDIGLYHGSINIQKNDLIKDYWTVDYWNSLIAKLNMAEIVGKYQPQPKPTEGFKVVSDVIVDTVITHDFFNDVETKMAVFAESPYGQVDQNDLITATIANAIGTAYNSAKFSTSVCDVCNSTSAQAKSECTCNCPTCSSCPTCSTCPSCSCNCSSCACSNCQGCACSNCQGCSTPGDTSK